MRHLTLLIVILLLAGFASRPSVVAAWSGGHVMIEVTTEAALLGDPAPVVHPDTGKDIHIAIAKCVPLAILPCAEQVALAGKPAIPAPDPHQFIPRDPSDSLLRPPRA